MHYLRKIVFCFTGKALISFWRLHKLSTTTFKFTFTYGDDNKVCNNDCIFDFGIGSVVSTTASYNVSLLFS